MRRNGLRKVMAAVAVALCAGRASADVLITPSTPYNQDFDILSNSTLTPTQAWTDNSTIEGWYASRTTYIVNNGSSNSGQLYSYGTIGSNERALGSVSSGTSGTVFFGAAFANGSSQTINSFSVAYTGEQWRDGGNTTGSAQTHNFQYSVDATSITAGTWFDFDSLDFTSPTHPSTATGSALDGNSPANQMVFALTEVTSTLNLAPGSSFWIRWMDINNGGNDHGLAIDSLTLSVAVPEPTSLACLAGVAMLCGPRRRRARHH
jgi:uncharacterized protein